MPRLIETIGNLAVIAALKPSCCLTIHGGQAALYTGSGPDRQMRQCSIYDAQAVQEMVTHLNREAEE